jgi:hypothetical protein
MSQAIFIIALVGFFGRLVYAAIAIRNWITVTLLSLLAVTIYGMPMVSGFSVARGVVRFWAAFDFVAVVLCSALLFVIGYGVPALLARAERKSRMWKWTAFLVGLLATFLTVDLARTIGSAHLIWVLLTPQACFVGGVIGYLVFHARIFESDSDSEPAQRRRM